MKIGEITGQIDGLSPRVAITVTGNGDSPKSYSALLDTGFDGALSIGLADASELGLRFIRDQVVVLADGSEKVSSLFAGKVYFAGDWREVPVNATGDDATIGMQLLYGASIRVDVVLNGDVHYELLNEPRLRWHLG